MSDFFLLKTRPGDTKYILWSLLLNVPTIYEDIESLRNLTPERDFDIAGKTGCSVDIDAFKWENRTSESGILIKHPTIGEYREIKLIDLEFFMKEKLVSEEEIIPLLALFDRFTTGNVTNERLREISPIHLLNVNPK